MKEEKITEENDNKILQKIKKRIELISRLNGTTPKKLYISQQEANELGEELKNIENVEGIKFEIIKKYEIRKDCLFYNGIDCDAMRELICKNGNCKRFNDKLTKEEIEESIRNYALKKSYDGNMEDEDVL